MTEEKNNRHGRLIGGIILIGIGLVFLLSNWGIIPDFSESWPIVLVIIGLALILGARGKGGQENRASEQKPKDMHPPHESQK